MHTLRVKLAGLGVVAGMVAFVTLAGAAYSQAFRSWVPVTLLTDRSGLIMDPGNGVKLRGVQVGEVTAVQARDGHVALSLELDPEAIGWIPANVSAEITATTAFGAKYVALAAPARPSTEHVREGAVLDNRGVTTEVDTVLDNLAAVVESIDPAKLSATLGVVAATLEGRGDDIAQFADQADSYLARLNPNLPTLQRDLEAAAEVSQLFADVSPDLLRILDNATVTSGTIVEEAPALDAFLLDFAVGARTVEDVLAQNEAGLVTVLDLLAPTTQLLARYSPMLTCFVEGLEVTRQLLTPAIGGAKPGINTITSVVPGQDAYRYPEDLPVIGADNGPACHGLPALSSADVPVPYLPTDTGTNPFASGNNAVQPGDPPLAVLLFGPIDGPGAQRGATAAEGPR